MTNNNAVYGTYATYRYSLLEYNTIGPIMHSKHCCKFETFFFLLELIIFTSSISHSLLWTMQTAWIISSIYVRKISEMHPTDWKLECQPSCDILRTMIVIRDKSEIATVFSTRKFQISMALTEVAWSLGAFKLKMYRKIRGFGNLGTKRSKYFSSSIKISKYYD